MPSTATTRTGLEKQAAGENSNTWGSKVNNNWDIIDASLNGVEAIVTAGGTTILANADYTVDQAKKRVLSCTGTGGTIQIPNLEKVYLIRNASTGSIVITTGSGATVTISAGTVQWVFSTGSNAVYAANSTSGGSYTPTVSNINNVSANTITALAYLKGGNAVNVGGKITLSLASSGWSIDLSLPIASTFTDSSQAGGVGYCPTRASVDSMFGVQSVAGGGLRLSGSFATSGSLTYWFNATYQVL